MTPTNNDYFIPFTFFAATTLRISKSPAFLKDASILSFSMIPGLTAANSKRVLVITNLGALTLAKSLTLSVEKSW